MFAKNSILFILLSLFFSSCKSNQIIENKREGYWIESYSLDSSQVDLHFKSKWKYFRDNPIKTWRYYKNKKIFKKEKYKKDYCLVTLYHKNRKIEKKGKTKTEITDKEAHWFYQGSWEVFNSKGKLVALLHYEDGILIKTDSITANKK